MRVVLVTGARHWKDDHIVCGTLSEQVRKYGPFVLVPGGSAVGVDALAHEWLSIEDPVCPLPCCEPRNLQLMRRFEESYPVDLRASGIVGITERNQRLIDRRPDVCLAFLTPRSRGSVDVLTRARIAGVPFVEHVAGEGIRAAAGESPRCSSCQHPALAHDSHGCRLCVAFIACAGYEVDPIDLV